MSWLLWGEHCVECAAPDCYQTCELYQPRPDKRCRRFVYGAHRNRNFPSLRNHGTEIVLKKWAKLEARGNTTLKPVAVLRLFDKLIDSGSPLLNTLGPLIERLTSDIRWSFVTQVLLERLGRGLHGRNRTGTRPDAFLLDVYNPGSEALSMQLTMTVSLKDSDTAKYRQRPRIPFRALVSFAPGYSKHEFSQRQFADVTEAGLPFDVALYPDADSRAHLVFLTADFVAYKQTTIAKQKAPNIKCVVWDLDNTLWRGVLLENAEVQPNPQAVKLLSHFDQRGVLNSIASKNDHAHAWQRLEELGLTDFFLRPQINWQPKSQSIQTIAHSLNIGLDTFAFIDDNPFELDEVSAALDMVTSINIDDVEQVYDDPRFQGSASGDAKNRREYYRNAERREAELVTQGLDYPAFLAASQIKLEILDYVDDDFERVSELVQRTNQLNFSGRKYTPEEIGKLIADPTLEKWVLKCSDKYGAYGTVGFCLVHRNAEAIRIEDFMLSCRVQGKMIEQAFFNFLGQQSADPPARTLSVNFQPTARNKPAQGVLEELHFAPGLPAEGLVLDLDQHPLTCDFIEIIRK